MKNLGASIRLRYKIEPKNTNGVMDAISSQTALRVASVPQGSVAKISEAIRNIVERFKHSSRCIDAKYIASPGISRTK